MYIYMYIYISIYVEPSERSPLATPSRSRPWNPGLRLHVAGLTERRTGCVGDLRHSLLLKLLVELPKALSGIYLTP